MNTVMIIGIILLIAGFVLVGIELVVPGFGAPGISGIICLVAGVFLTADTQDPENMEALEELIGVVLDEKRHRMIRHTWGNGV